MGKMLEIAIAATKDFNGDGITDQWGVENAANGAAHMQLIASNGVDVVRADGDSYLYNLDDQR